MRKLAITITGIFALTLATAGCKQEIGTPEPVRPVLTTVVEPTRPASTIAAGTVETRYTTNIGFRVLGRLIARPVNVGDLAEEGQILAAIDPTTLELAVQSEKQSFHETTLDLRMQAQRKNETDTDCQRLGDKG